MPSQRSRRSSWPTLQADLEYPQWTRNIGDLDEAVKTLGLEAELSPRAMKRLGKLDKPTARRIIDYLRETASGVVPLSRTGLTSNLAGFWRYRIPGNYRIIASIEDDGCDPRHQLIVWVTDLPLTY